MTQPGYPLSENVNAMSIITDQYNQTFSKLSNLYSKLFALGTIFGEPFLTNYNQLFYNNLCSNTSCISALGENQGINSILYNYYDYMVRKYQAVLAANGTYDLTTLYPLTTQNTENDYKELMKKHWRQLEHVTLEGLKLFLLDKDTLFFGVMLGICILNCTVLLWAWMSFYRSL